jgi:hypothetical protein
MNKIIFYNLEKNNVRLCIQGGTSYENAIETCKEFIASLQEDMATSIANQELAEKKLAEESKESTEASDGGNQ